jgi:hypothetical protein
MKQVTLGVYCNVHLDLPVMVANDLDISTLTKSQLTSLIMDGKIKSKNETVRDLITGHSINDECLDLVNGDYTIGSFGMSKVNYIMDDNIVNVLKKK